MKLSFLLPGILLILYGCTQPPVTDLFNQHCMDQSELELEKMATTFSLLAYQFDDMMLEFDLPSCAADSHVRVISGSIPLCQQYCEFQTSQCRLVEQSRGTYRAYACIDISPDITLFPAACPPPSTGRTMLDPDQFTSGKYYFSRTADDFGQVQYICGYREA